jgi:hypothetical protein
MGVASLLLVFPSWAFTSSSFSNTRLFIYDSLYRQVYWHREVRWTSI